MRRHTTFPNFLYTLRSYLRTSSMRKYVRRVRLIIIIRALRRVSSSECYFDSANQERPQGPAVRRVCFTFQTPLALLSLLRANHTHPSSKIPSTSPVCSLARVCLCPHTIKVLSLAVRSDPHPTVESVLTSPRTRPSTERNRWF